MRCLLCLVGIALASAFAPSAAADDLTGRIEAAPSSLADDLTGRIENALASDGAALARAGVHVVSLPAGEVVYAVRAERAYIPASNQKVLVSAAALDVLGAEFRWTTRLARRGDDLVIFGSGDPGAGDPELAKAAGEPITAMFHRWAAALQQAGLTEIAGDLVVDAHAFDEVWFHPSWSPGDLDDWYGAPVGGLSFHDNCIDVTVLPGRKAGAATTVRVVPGNTLTKIVNRSRTASKGVPVIARKGLTHEYVISGNCAKASKLASVPVVEPPAFFASACRTALAAKGIRIRGDIRHAMVRLAKDRLPDDCRLIAVHHTRLIDALPRMNKPSQNFFAESLIKTLGRYDASAEDGPVRVGTWPAGAAAVERFVARVAGDATGLVVDDGSGLSRKNRVSPKQITAVLTHLFHGPHRDVFRESLAVAGVDGTLRRRMRDQKGRIFAKTGYISGVRSLSGYVHAESGRWFAFSFLYNDVKPRIGTRRATQLQDKLCRVLADE